MTTHYTEKEHRERLNEVAPQLLEALQLIARSDTFCGGTFVLELQQIAREAVKKATE